MFCTQRHHLRFIELYTIVSARQITELSIVGPRIKKLAIHLGGSTKEEAHRILAEAEACGTGVRELSLQNIDTNMFFNTNIEYSFPRVEILTLENITASHEHHIPPFKFECLNELIMVDPLTHGLVGLLFLVKNPIQKITIGRYDEDMDEALMHTPNVIKEKIETITIRESGLKPTKLIHSMTNHFKNLINIDLRGIDLSDVPMPLWCNIIQEWTKIESFKATFFPNMGQAAQYFSKFCPNFRKLTVHNGAYAKTTTEIELAKILRQNRFELETCRLSARKFVSKKFCGKIISF